MDKLYSNQFKKNDCLEVVLTFKSRKTQMVGTIKAVLAFSNNKFVSPTVAINLYINEHNKYEHITDYDNIVNYILISN